MDEKALEILKVFELDVCADELAAIYLMVHKESLRLQEL